MSQKYLLIPLDSIKECDDNEYYHLSWIKSRGEIVQSESIGGFIHETGLKGSDLAIDIFVNGDYKLVKKVGI